MKVKIIKPFIQSGYFKNQIIEVDKSEIENIQRNNIIQIIEEVETSNIVIESEKAIKKTVKRGRPKKG